MSGILSDIDEDRQEYLYFGSTLYVICHSSQVCALFHFHIVLRAFRSIMLLNNEFSCKILSAELMFFEGSREVNQVASSKFIINNQQVLNLCPFVFGACYSRGVILMRLELAGKIQSASLISGTESEPDELVPTPSTPSPNSATENGNVSVAA